MKNKAEIVDKTSDLLHSIGLSKKKSQEISSLTINKIPANDRELNKIIKKPNIILLALIECLHESAHFQEEIIICINYLTRLENKLSKLQLGKLFHAKAIKFWRFDNNLLFVYKYLNNSVDLLSNLKSNEAADYLARVHDTYGQILVSQGLFFEGRTQYEKALEIKQKIKDLNGLAITKGNLGRLSIQLGDYESGIKHIEEDLDIIRKHQPHEDRIIAKLLSNLSWCYVLINDKEKAEKANDESHLINKKNKNETGIAFNLINNAEIALMGEKTQLAHLILKELDEIIDSKTISASINNSLKAYKYRVEALMYFIQGRHLDANESFEKAFSYYLHNLQISDVSAANLMYKYAQLALQTNNKGFAGKLYSKALKLLDSSEEDVLRQKIEDELKTQFEDKWLLHSSGRFLGHDQLDFLLNEAGKKNFTGEEKDVVILFSDLRSFTSISESLSPKEVINLLNSFLSKMTKAIKFYGGFVDKFIGDAVMAIFSLPNPKPVGPMNDADRAVKAALLMTEELRRMNNNLPKELPKLQMGIGLHAGKVTAGLIGSAQKRSYTVIGDAVNTTARLEGMTKMLGVNILITAQVNNMLSNNDVLVRPLGKYCPKGRIQHVEVFEVIGLDDNSPRLAYEKNETALLNNALNDFRESNFNKAISKLLRLSQNTKDHQSKVKYDFLIESIEKQMNNPVTDEWDGEIILYKK